MLPLKSLRIGYDCFSANLSHPGDRRRFCYLAKLLNINYEIYNPLNKYDLVILNEHSDITYWRRKKGPKIIYNLNHSYLAEQINFKTIFRGLAKFFSGQHKFLDLNFINSIQKMCLRSDAVICSTKDQKKDLERYCKNTHIFFDAFSEIKIKKNNYRSHKPFRLVWEGQPSNIYQLQKVTNLLANSELKNKVELHVITDKYGYKHLNKFFKYEVENSLRKLSIKSYFHEWSLDTLQKSASNCDLAIIPIDMDDPITVGKPENKLLLFWKIGLPTLVSATPAYKNVMKNAKQKYFVEDLSMWTTYIDELISSEKKRIRAAHEGYAFFENNYSDEYFIKQWEKLFNSIGFSI